MPIACSLDNGRLNVIKGLLAAVHHLENHRAKLISLDYSIFITVQEACIAYIDNGRVGRFLSRIGGVNGLGYDTGTPVFTGKIINAVIAGIGFVKTTIGRWQLPITAVCTVLLPFRHLTLVILPRPFLLIRFRFGRLSLLGRLPNRSSDHRTAGHSHNRSEVGTTRPARNTANGTAQDRP